MESRDRKDKKVNEKKQTNKKDRIKNIAIVYLVIMLLLTFFSNTIMNYSLPEVSATYAQNGSVTAKVRGTGTVETAEDYDVKVTENHVVGSVKIKVGDEVSADQVLFELDGTGTTDETARHFLPQLRIMHLTIWKSNPQGKSSVMLLPTRLRQQPEHL